MRGGIFISYRRGDGPGFAGRLYDRLEQRFSAERVFLDVDNIAPGADFVEVLHDKVAACDVLLAVIGRGWADARDGNGALRLHNPDDFVRIEIEQALSQGKRVIPVLIDGAEMPQRQALPATLNPLLRRNAVRVTHEGFRSDVDRLVDALAEALDESNKPPNAGPAPENHKLEEPPAKPSMEPFNTAFGDVFEDLFGGKLSGAEAVRADNVEARKSQPAADDVGPWDEDTRRGQLEALFGIATARSMLEKERAAGKIIANSQRDKPSPKR
jgi:hypothetical protein